MGEWDPLPSSLTCSLGFVPHNMPHDMKANFPHIDLGVRESIHHFCHILFVRDESRNSVYSQGEGRMQRCEH